MKREKWIDYTKLFACILVVIGHLLQGLNLANIKWNQNLYTNINNYIYIFHMPFFMCLSGYLYGKYTKIESKQNYFQFIKKKIINLGIPYIVFYIMTVVISMIFSSSVNSSKGVSDILAIFTHPISPYWFIYILLFIFIIMPIIEWIFKGNIYLTVFMLLILHVISILLPIDIYVIDLLMIYIIYFYMGKIISIKQNLCSHWGGVLLYIIVFNIISVVICYLEMNYPSGNVVIQILTLIAAILSLYAFLSLFKNIELKIKPYRFINFLSKYTFPIFLMHTIFSAGIRIVLLKIGIDNFYIHFIFGLTFGMLGPIIVMKILEYTKYLEFFVYPLNTIKKLKKD